jgi:hypothetical protein
VTRLSPFVIFRTTIGLPSRKLSLSEILAKFHCTNCKQFFIIQSRMESFNALFRCAFLPCNAYFKNAFQTNGDSYRKLNCNRQCTKLVIYLTSSCVILAFFGKKAQITQERVECNVFLFDEPLKGSKSLKIFKISLTFRFDKLSNLSNPFTQGAFGYYLGDASTNLIDLNS